ncbi:hypothetical protein BGW39_001687 [Mortierella sp. 14UC]|nr:hypothetical protein BGW39_001687 [Mortierella sp. 14UC]
MQVQSSLVHSPYHDIEHCSLFSAIERLVGRSARGFRTLAAGIPLRKIAKVIYYACLVVGFATFVVTASSSVFFSVPVAQIAGFVARYLGRMALAPLIEQIIIGVSVAGVTGVTVDYAWTKKQLAAASRERDAVVDYNTTLTRRVSALENMVTQIMASIKTSSSNTVDPTPSAPAPAIPTQAILTQDIPTQAVPTTAIPAAATSAAATSTPVIILTPAITPTPFIPPPPPPVTPEPLDYDSTYLIF